MGFLIKLWNIISTAVVLLPKVWPILKVLFSKVLDHWAKNRVKENKKEELKKAAEEAEKTLNTHSLEASLGSGVVVGDSNTEVVLSESANAIAPDPSLDEKKKSLEPQSRSETGGEKTSSKIIETGAKIAAAGFAVYILSSLFNRKEAKASSTGFSSTSSGVILEGVGTKKNYAVFKGGFRVGSRLLP